jgi:hypothetical protein
MTRYGIVFLLVLACLVTPALAANLFNYSEQVNNSVWMKSYVYKLYNNTVSSPNGTWTGDTYNTSSGTEIHGVYQTIPTTYGLPYTISAYFKKNGANDFVQLVFQGTRFGTAQYTIANISSCEVVVTGGNTSNTWATANGSWCRVSHTSTSYYTGNTNAFFLFNGEDATTGRAPVYNGTEHLTESVAIWGMKAEQGSAPTDYLGEYTEETGGGWASFTPLTTNNLTIFGSANVTFTNTNTATSPTGYVWTYQNVTGDNVLRTFSTSASPTYTFQAPSPSGSWNYSISLTVTNATGPNTTPLHSHFVNVSRWDQDGEDTLPLLPANHVFRYDISSLPKNASSDSWMTAIATHRYSSANKFFVYQARPVQYVGDDVPTSEFLFDRVQAGYREPDYGDYPVPEDWAYEQGGSDGKMAIYNRDTRISYDFSYISDSDHIGGRYPNGSYVAGYGSIIDFTNLSFHKPIGRVSTQISGLPETPLLYTKADAASGSLDHAVGVSLLTPNGGSYIWPASYGMVIGEGTYSNRSFPPHGQRVRLKSSFNVEALSVSENAKILLRGLQKYGGIFSITGGYNTNTDSTGEGLGIQAEKGVISDASTVYWFTTVPLSEFEWVDESSLISSPTSYAVAGYGEAPTAHFYMNETVTAPVTVYGSDYFNTSSNPIGGGAGYSGIITTGDYIAVSKDALIANLSQAQPGQTIYIPNSTTIDFTGDVAVTIPTGVTLASNRGYLGSSGALIKKTAGGSPWGWEQPTLKTTGTNVRVTGLRFEGEQVAQGGTGAGESKYLVGVEAEFATNFIFDNNEGYGWSWAVVSLDRSKNSLVKNNYMHHNQAAGEGYGVNIYAGNSTVERNLFDYNRHDITGAGLINEQYEYRYNLVLGHGNTAGGSRVDVHKNGAEPGDPGYGLVIAGDRFSIHHNTFKAISNYQLLLPIEVSEKPMTNMTIYNNIFEGTAVSGGYYTAPVRQLVDVTFGNVSAFNNYWKNSLYPANASIIMYEVR